MSAKNDLDKFQKQVEAALKELTSAQSMRKIGDDASKRIKVRTRLGKGVDASNPEENGPKPLKKLSKSYKDQRSGKVAFFSRGRGSKRAIIPYVPKTKPTLHPETTAGKSNLTRTGELLDSIKTLRASQGEATVGVSGSHKSGITLEKLVEYVEKDRAFLALTKPEISGIRLSFQESLRKLIDKFTK